MDFEGLTALERAYCMRIIAGALSINKIPNKKHKENVRKALEREGYTLDEDGFIVIEEAA